MPTVEDGYGRKEKGDKNSTAPVFKVGVWVTAHQHARVSRRTNGTDKLGPRTAIAFRIEDVDGFVHGRVRGKKRREEIFLRVLALR